MASDVPAIVAMGLRFLRETTYAVRIGENVDRMTELAARLIAQDDSALVVAKRDGELVGMLGAVVYPHHISGEIVAGEIFWWMNPEARGSTGVRLLRAVERWARDRGAKYLEMIAPDARVGQLYQRLGYQAAETTFHKVL